ncbi:MAG: galactose mutarotase [Verrucomicrobia bacterium]|nr:galactose mutarotase [Verrucomicrobiota bacterium]
MIQRRHFGEMPTGETVDQFELSNASGLRVAITTYGAIVTELHVPDAAGVTADVVLGFDRLAPYLAEHPYFGATVGRVAGRISDGRFVIDGDTTTLACNEPPNHLHGGFRAMDKHLWQAEPLDDDAAPALRLTTRSPDGEEGYPGNLDVAVTYTLRDAALEIQYAAVTDKATPLSLTNHAYFNLAGEGRGSIADHWLEILADEFVPTDDKLTLLGRRERVSGQSNDFRQARRLGDVIPKLWLEHGDVYWLREQAADAPVLAARVTHNASGRTMTVHTTDTCLQFYTGKFMDGSLIGKGGEPYGPHAGFCLECHGYSDATTRPGFGDIILRPGDTYRRCTVYGFTS